MEQGAFCWCNPLVIHAEEIEGIHEVDAYIIHSPDKKLDYKLLIMKSGVFHKPNFQRKLE